MPFTTRLHVEPSADDTWRLLVPLGYRGAIDTWTIPAGYVTDFGSIPWVASWLVARYGRWTRATVVHDYLITNELPAGRIDPVDIDGVFRRILRELGVSTPRRWLMWAGVRWGALFGGRARGWLPTAPAVLAISLAALPAVAVGALGVVVGRLPLALAEWVSPMREAMPDAIPTPRAAGAGGSPLVDLAALRRSALDGQIDDLLNGPQPIDRDRLDRMIDERVRLDDPKGDA